jgi:hypothetical protein
MHLMNKLNITKATTLLFVFGMIASMAYPANEEISKDSLMKASGENIVNWSSKLLFYGEGGKLQYIPDEQGNVIPDYSHVGYHYGDDPVPDVPVVMEISPMEGDDYLNIQSAVNTIAAMPLDENGFRGALLLKKGEYQLNGSIFLRADGIVLRGEGDNEEGTVIRATGTSKRALIDVGVDENLIVDHDSKTKIIESYVPVGRQFVRIENPERFSVGDEIALYRPGTADWISDIKMNDIPYKAGVVQWSPSSYSFYFERIITRITDDTLFFRNPVVMAMEDQYGGGYVYKATMPRYKNIGIEDLMLVSDYTFATDENHAWYGVVFRNALHSWARRITSKHFAYACVSVGWDAKHISVLNCTSLEPISQVTGGRRYSFNLEGQLSLFKGCFASHGRHDFVSSARVCGPNVFTRSTAVNPYSDAGPHHRWAMGTLFDSIVTGGQLNVQDRGNSGTGHGWAGVNQVFWNCRGSSSVCQSPWASGLNYNIGFQGYKDAGWNTGRPDGEWEGQNVPGLLPSSLYEAQLNDRTKDMRYFSLISGLEQVTTNSYLLSFNMPFNQEEAGNKSNYLLQGTAGAQDLEWELSVENERQVLFTFQGLSLLDPFATIIIDAGNIHSEKGLTLEVLTRASYTEPDKRPVTFYEFQRVDNGPGSYLTVLSSKKGNIFLVPHDLVIHSIENLDGAVNSGVGLVEEVEPVTTVRFYTEGLPVGKYVFYAVDLDGRISSVPATFVYIEQVTSMQTPTNEKDIMISGSEGIINVRPSDEMPDSAELTVFTIHGKKIYQGICPGELQIQVPGAGVYLVRLSAGDYVHMRKLFVE